MGNVISILSTRALKIEYIDAAKRYQFNITCIPFIEINYTICKNQKEEISNLLTQKITVIITSQNGVEALLKNFSPQAIATAEWYIYAIGYATKEKITQYLKKSIVIGIAENVDLLSNKIIETNSGKTIYFLGSNIRSQEWIDKLQQQNINVQEYLIYQTKELCIPINCIHYQAILFFSPSAVNAFFKNNILQKNMPIFAIGKTTESAIYRYGKYAVFTPVKPTFKNILETIKNYFKIYVEK